MGAWRVMGVRRRCSTSPVGATANGLLLPAYPLQPSDDVARRVRTPYGARRAESADVTLTTPPEETWATTRPFPTGGRRSIVTMTPLPTR